MSAGLLQIKEALTLCNDRNLRQITGSRIVRTQAERRWRIQQPEAQGPML